MPAKKKGVSKKRAKPSKSKPRPKARAPKRAAKKSARPAAKKKAAKTAAAARKRTAPKPPVLPWRNPLPGETKLGVVEDYFAHINVIAMTLERPVSVGDKIHVHGHTTDFTEPVESMQMEHQSIAQARRGDAVGIKVIGRCRKGDYVYRVAA